MIQTFLGAACRLISGENINKGDTLLENGKRILVFSTNDLLEIAARAAEILGDGTFKITPKLWGKMFVISARVTSTVFVPVAVFLLPDKTRVSYSEAFSLFREALETRGLTFSSEWFMSDFEVAIKQEFTNQLPMVKPKGKRSKLIEMSFSDNIRGSLRIKILLL